MELPLLQKESTPTGSPKTTTMQQQQNQPKSHAGVGTQLVAVVKKTLRQKRHHACGTVLEMLLPCILLLLIGVLSLSYPPEDKKGEHFFTPSTSPATLATLEDELVRSVCYRNTSATTTNPMPVPACPASITNDTCFVDARLEATTPIIRAFCFTNKTHWKRSSEAFYDADPRNMIGAGGLDAVIIMHWAMRQIRNYDVSPGPSSVESGTSLPSGLIFTPDAPQTHDIVARLNASSSLFRHVFLGYRSMEDAESWVYSLAGEGRAWAIVDIQSFSAATKSLSYTLRMNRTMVPNTNRVRERFRNGLGSKAFLRYQSSGFTALQMTLHRAFAESLGVASTRLESPEFLLAGAPMPYDDYEEKIFISITGLMLPLIVVLSYLYPVSQLVKRIVEEKELRIREGMMIMGLGKVAFYGGWLVTYSLQYTIVALVSSLIASLLVLKNSSFVVILLVFLVFNLSIVTLSMLFSTVFSKSRMAALVSPFLFCIISIPVFAIDSEASKSIFLAFSICSPSAFVYALRTCLDYELGRGIGLGDIVSTVDSINVATNLAFLVLDLILYFFLAVYLDEVLPNEWGTPRHPLFFVMPSFWVPKKSDPESAPLVTSPTHGFGEEMVYVTPKPPAIGPESDRSQKKTNLLEHRHRDAAPTVVVDHLKKQFDEKVAVNNLSTELYADEITVLLGHNGAGKTTSINMITGMIPMTSGEVTVYGNRVSTSLSAIRQNLGLCPQHNILWPQLTCEQHLDFYAQIKGLNATERDAAITKMLQAVGLVPERHKAAGSLSGGQKRKLSVAIAFIGGSQFVILDEPTAGMDVNARHDTWQLLRDMTPGRTILLTTHFMDEADVLGHTITIMTHGQVYCSGSSVYLKSRLGVGYTLDVGITATCNVDALTNLIASTIRGSEVTSCYKGTVSYLLPTLEVASFPKLFSKLELLQGELGVQSFSITNTTLEEIFTHIADEGHTPKPDPASPRTAAASPTTALKQAKAAGDVVWAAPREDVPGRTMRHLRAIIRKRFHYALRDRRSFVFQIVLPIVFVSFAMILDAIGGPPQYSSLVLGPGMYDEDPMLLSTVNCSAYNKNFNGIYHVQDLTSEIKSTASAGYQMSQQLLARFDTHGDEERYLSFYCGEPNVSRTIVFHNGTGPHALPEGIASYHSAFLKTRTGAAVSLIASSYPLDFTARESAIVEQYTSFITAFFVLIPFTFVPATYAAWIVKEKECKVKHLQLVSGLSPVAYWAGNFVWDTISYLVTECCTILVFVIFNKEQFIGSGESFFAVFLVFLLFGLSGMSFAYAATPFFSNHSSAQNAVMLTNFIAGFAFVMTIQIMDLLDMDSEAEPLRYIFRFVPAYCLGEGLIKISTLDGQKAIKSLSSSSTALSFDVIGAPCLYMFVLSIAFFIAAVLSDSAWVLKARAAMAHTNAHANDEEDVDVVAERKRVEGGADDDLVRILGLRKEFDTNIAVRNLTLGIHRGEIFGFLGTNGAGKTTTLSILSGDFPPTNGSATLCGYDVVNQSNLARKHLGLCPQFDALLDLLTPKEHLQLFCALRQVPTERVDQAVDALIEAAGLTEYINVPSKRLSGGTKRKLCLALSLVGAPDVVFLDEPSAGMDPVARRGLWDTIRQTAVGRCVVLTTHHLEEVEALAHRVAIMVRGGMRCIGTLPHVKSKYGGGYELLVTLNSTGDVDTLVSLVQGIVRDGRLSESHANRHTFLLPQSSTRLSQLFDAMEKNRARIGVDDYSISQTSLEQVFIRISQEQHRENVVSASDSGATERVPGNSRAVYCPIDRNIPEHPNHDQQHRPHPAALPTATTQHPPVLPRMVDL